VDCLPLKLKMNFQFLSRFAKSSDNLYPILDSPKSWGASQNNKLSENKPSLIGFAGRLLPCVLPKDTSERINSDLTGKNSVHAGVPFFPLQGFYHGRRKSAIAAILISLLPLRPKIPSQTIHLAFDNTIRLSVKTRYNTRISRSYWRLGVSKPVYRLSAQTLIAEQGPA